MWLVSPNKIFLLHYQNKKASLPIIFSLVLSFFFLDLCCVLLLVFLSALSSLFFIYSHYIIVNVPLNSNRWTSAYVDGMSTSLFYRTYTHLFHFDNATSHTLYFHSAHATTTNTLSHTHTHTHTHINCEKWRVRYGRDRNEMKPSSVYIPHRENCSRVYDALILGYFPYHNVCKFPQIDIDKLMGHLKC